MARATTITGCTCIMLILILVSYVFSDSDRIGSLEVVPGATNTGSFVSSSLHHDSEPLPEKALAEDSIWIAIHYHKTGRSLSHSIFRAISARYNLKFRKNPLGKRVNLPSPQALKRAVSGMRLIAQVAPGKDTRNVINLLTFFPQARIVHFVRDAFAMTLSGAQYHAHAPKKEGWAFYVNSFCNASIASTRGKQLVRVSEFMKAVDASQLWDGAKTICKEIESKIPNVKGIGFAAKMQYLYDTKGDDFILFEAARLILRGDLSFMLEMILMLQDNKQVLQLNMSEFTASASQFEETSRCLLSFLDHEKRNPEVFEAAIAKIVRTSDLKSGANPIGGKKHITTAKLDESEMDRRRAVLDSHSLFGPWLRAANSVVFAARPPFVPKCT